MKRPTQDPTAGKGGGTTPRPEEPGAAPRPDPDMVSDDVAGAPGPTPDMATDHAASGPGPAPDMVTDHKPKAPFKVHEGGLAGADRAEDPIDLLEEALSYDAEEPIPVKQVLASVAVRKPRDGEFFRTHRAEEAHRTAWVLFDRGEGIGETVYAAVGPARTAIGEHLKLVRLMLCINRNGVVFIWPIKLTQPGARRGSDNQWTSSSLVAAHEAQASWVKMKAGDHAYIVRKAEGDLPEPVWPKAEIREFYDRAFQETLIAHLGHPIVQRLRGLV
jgi:hypothetical protein